jgi:hypothetical protein
MGCWILLSSGSPQGPPEAPLAAASSSSPLLRPAGCSRWAQETGDGRTMRPTRPSPVGLVAFGRGKRVICMDGLDLFDTLDREIPLSTALDRKVRRAAETGLPFERIRDLFSRQAAPAVSNKPRKGSSKLDASDVRYGSKADAVALVSQGFPARLSRTSRLRPLCGAACP